MSTRSKPSQKHSWEAGGLGFKRKYSALLASEEDTSDEELESAVISRYCSNSIVYTCHAETDHSFTL